MMQDKPQLSIIIPVYNVEKYIRECLDSIRNQSFTDFEVLLIDDGSSDGSGRICDEYVELDSRFKVFHKKNEGVSSARNMGLDNAKGDWIHFIDSDDYLLTHNVYQELLDHRTQDADIINFGCSGQLDLVFKWSTEQGDQTKAKDAYLKTMECFVWSNLFKKETIGDIRFEKIKIYEDLLFISEVAVNSKFFFTGKTLYYYRERPDSAVNTREYIKDFFEETKILTDKLNSLDEQKKIFDRKIFNRYTLFRFYYGAMNEVKRKKINESTKLLRKYASIFKINELIDERGLNVMLKEGPSWLLIRLGMFRTFLVLHSIKQKISKK